MLAVVALNMGGPDSPQAVEPFLRNLFRDPDLIQLGWMRPLQPLLARMIARRRAPFSRAAYAQIGGRSPIREESQAQVAAVVKAMEGLGIPARPYVAMSYWHPFPAETAARMRDDGITRALLLPLYPHRSRTTTGSVLRTMQVALAEHEIDSTGLDGFATAPGYIEALCARIQEVTAELPEAARTQAPVLRLRASGRKPTLSSARSPRRSAVIAGRIRRGPQCAADADSRTRSSTPSARSRASVRVDGSSTERHVAASRGASPSYAKTSTPEPTPPAGDPPAATGPPPAMT